MAMNHVFPDHRLVDVTGGRIQSTNRGLKSVRLHWSRTAVGSLIAAKSFTASGFDVRRDPRQRETLSESG